MKKGLLLGFPFGIGLYVHWTFALLLAWVGLAGMTAGGFSGAILSMVLIIALFACVVLHELGHSLTARRFGIPTHSITLYPIGGVAELASMPRQPKQELLIALAGPAVNVVIAAALFPLAAITGFAMPNGIAPQTLPQLITTLMVTNVALVIFNMIPAFPMDGGRVLRSVLAFSGNYKWATNIAARIGQVVAVLFVLAGLGLLGAPFNPMLVLIGGFVFLAAGNERAMAMRAATSFGGFSQSSFVERPWYRTESGGLIPDEFIEIIPPERSKKWRRGE